MADKIAKFEDYKKKDNAEDIDIQIEDPYNFFNEEEREEYFRERQKELQKEKDQEEPVEKRPGRPKGEPEPQEKYEEEEYDEEEYDDEEPEYDDDEEEENRSGGFPIELFIRISSIITGIVILAFLAIVGKVKIYDKYFAKDPDEVQVEAPALPAGYTEKNDTVKVTAKSLNLRTVASSESDATIVTAVPEGTELKRIAVSEDEKWALVEYNGTWVYASMKYLTTP
ncbi:MAG: SH3 domain-containing protein [Butyrivibrio sp.]|nr:SH3 domain-containing protein [Butyrivibrio sp.]